MPEVNIAAIQSLVVWGGFVLAFIFGFVANRTHFCVMGAIADIVGMGNWDRMRMWIVAMATAILGTALLVGTGQIDTAKSIYTGARLLWLSTSAGGVLFGFGMVLASGCGSKTLVRIGQGNIKSLVVFFVMAIAAYMTMRGLFAVWRVASVDRVAFDLPGNQDLGALIAASTGIAKRNAQMWTGIAVALALFAGALLPRGFRESEIRSDILLGGLVIGAVIVGAWYLTGHLGFIAEDPATLEERFVGTNSGRMESFTFTAPFGYALELLTLWSDTSQTLSFGVATLGGVTFGSLAHALLTRSFRWEGFRGTEDTANHVVGGALMGAGGVTALGCTIGQGVTGMSTLALGSILATAGIISGAVAATRYQIRRLDHAA